MKIRNVLVLLFGVLVSVQFAFGQTKYETYGNSRFEYSIRYPVGVLEPQEEAPNGDGRVFLSKNGTAELRVWGQYNALFDTLKKAFLSDIKERGSGVTYKVLLADSYIISGVKNGKIYYQKTMLNGKDGDGGAIFATFTFEYKKADKARFDPIVKRVARSFKFD